MGIDRLIRGTCVKEDPTDEILSEAEKALEKKGTKIDYY